jgi:hypothetical protein
MGCKAAHPTATGPSKGIASRSRSNPGDPRIHRSPLALDYRVAQEQPTMTAESVFSVTGMKKLC